MGDAFALRDVACIQLCSKVQALNWDPLPSRRGIDSAPELGYILRVRHWLTIGLVPLAACGRLAGVEPVPRSAGTTPAGASQAALDSGVTPRPDAGPDAGSPAALKSTLFPIVLAHGFAVSANTPEASFGPAAAALRDAGFTVFTTDAPAFDSIAVRGASLLETIEQVVAQTGAPAVNVIAHSMGGLDARYVASPGGLGRGDLVASISTLATPHRGTQLADAVNALMPYGLSPLLTAVSVAFDNLNLGDPHVQAALANLSESYLAGFNAATPDDPRVYYQSWAGVATATGAPDANIPGACEHRLVLPGVTKRLDPLLIPLAVVVGHALADWPNDGIVAAQSAAWGDFWGCLPVDHFNEIGDTQLAALVPFPDPDPDTGFDLAGFYVSVARGLAARGD